MAIKTKEQKRAGGEARTPDLLITNQLLYQLSYAGNFKTITRWFLPIYNQKTPKIPC
jgi:hypothetical protein